MGQERNKAREQEPLLRAKNFEEVSQGFDEEVAFLEANRCLNCKNAKEVPSFLSDL